MNTLTAAGSDDYHDKPTLAALIEAQRYRVALCWRRYVKAMRDWSRMQRAVNCMAILDCYEASARRARDRWRANRAELDGLIAAMEHTGA